MKVRGRETAAIAVVHLARAANGAEPLRRFITSYVEHPAGCAHDLVLLCKGFRERQLPPEILTVVEHVPHKVLHVTDHGVDLDAYVMAARLLPHEYVCFVNSYSRILADDWLGKLHAAIEEPGVGLAGTSGSAETMAPSRNGDGARRWRDRIVDALLARPWRLSRDFPVFPNYAIRTNGFIIRRTLFTEIAPRRIGSKRRAYRFESGRAGLTRAVQSRGLEVRMVGVSGSFPTQRWAGTGGFRQGRQSDLLIADNQTDRFAVADQATRELLAQLAWGDSSLAGVDE